VEGSITVKYKTYKVSKAYNVVLERTPIDNKISLRGKFNN